MMKILDYCSIKEMIDSKMFIVVYRYSILDNKLFTQTFCLYFKI